MPKVETSKLLKRGDINRLAAPRNENCVSNCFGYYGEKSYTNKQRFGLKTNKQIRFKRNIEEPNLDVEHSLPKRRVVKKLIRIQPIYNQTLVLNNRNKNIDNYLGSSSRHSENSLSSSEEDYSASSTASKKHYRKRVVVKKRRKKRPSAVVESSTTHSRRFVVITKKRLLSSTIQPTNPTLYQVQESTALANKTFILQVSASDNIQNFTENPLETTIESTTTSHQEEHEAKSNTTKSFPAYEPFFPELSESLDAPILILKTTVITSIGYETKTIVQNRLRTYTSVVTRVNGDEQIITSTIEVRPQTQTLTVTETRTKITTLTLVNLDPTETLPFVPLTVDSSSLGTTPHYTDTQEYDGRIFEEARYNNLATRIMSNGVEVIVAGDKSTLPGEPDVKRVLPSSIYKPVTLKPSTLSDHMMMMLPQEASNVESLSSSLHPHQFVTKTCLTTFTYLTTFFENGTTTISSHEQVVSNIATEERNTANIIPTPTTGITLTQHPNLAVGIFMTTYTYLNTILDGEQPLVVTSKHTVTNTVTAPDDYLSLMQPPKQASAVKDTNTYYSTIALQKTLYEDKESKIISTNEIVTQVVITESIPPKATSVMTSYIALDFEDNEYNSLTKYSTTDVVKTYYVTYTYLDTLVENGQTVVNRNISTSSDVVTEKLFLHPKRTHSNSIINTSPITNEKKKNKIDVVKENFNIHATKTYVTTFTYFTTLLQENKKDTTSTVVSSHTREVENVVTETIDHNLLDKHYLHSLQDELKNGTSRTLVKLATLQNGQKLEITAINNEPISPTKVLPIVKTQMIETSISPPLIESSNPNVVTGSTIIFFDEIDQIDSSTTIPTPSLTKPKVTKTTAKNGLGSLLSSEIVKKSQVIKQTSKSQSKRHTNKQTRLPIISSKTAAHHQAAITAHLGKNKTITEPAKKKTPNKITKPTADIPDLLGLGSINMNTLHALKPVINVMADIIQTNLKSNRRNDSVFTTPAPKFETTIIETYKQTSHLPPAVNIQDRSPVYIPLGADAEGLEIAESQNVATIHINEWEDQNKPHKDQVVVGKPTYESPLLNGGIPISPGEVITANSDVIVGKPGRIGPRIPSIPLNKEYQDEIPIDMKPPPVHHKTWPKRHNDKFVEPLPSSSIRTETPDLGGKQNDYYGPPPPVSPPKIPLRPSNFVRGEKHKPLDRKRTPQPLPIREPNRIPLSFQNLEVPMMQESRPAVQVVVPQIVPLQIPLEPPIILTKPVYNINIQPSILNEPIVLPEVIERSSGQPLLVNLQPSQVAFVNIPHNRTTALIYGGSTEPHRNGQYFDDPSPYPEPEFSGIENFNNGIPQYASVYDDTQPPNQKQVEGVIKVGTNVINNHPSPSIHSPQIRPSRPISKPTPYQIENGNNFPISFGMVQHGDFNAHIINHGDIHHSNTRINNHGNVPYNNEFNIHNAGGSSHANNYNNIHTVNQADVYQNTNFKVEKVPDGNNFNVQNNNQGEGHHGNKFNDHVSNHGDIYHGNVNNNDVRHESDFNGHINSHKDIHHNTAFNTHVNNHGGVPHNNEFNAHIVNHGDSKDPNDFKSHNLNHPEVYHNTNFKTHANKPGHVYNGNDFSGQNTNLGEVHHSVHSANQGDAHHNNNFNTHVGSSGNIHYNPSLNIENQNIIPQETISHPQSNILPIHQKNEHFSFDYTTNRILPDNVGFNKPPIELLRPLNNKPVRSNTRPNIFEHLHPHLNRHRLRPTSHSNTEPMGYPPPPQTNKFKHNRPGIPIRLDAEAPLNIPSMPSRPYHQHHPRPHIPIKGEPERDIVVPQPQDTPEMPINFESEITYPSIKNSNFSINKPVLIPLSPQNYNEELPPHGFSTYRPDFEEEIDHHKEDDIANEAGEVIQESYSRPLRPGQIPAEILRANLTKPSSFKNHSISFPESHNVNFGIKVAGHNNQNNNYNSHVIQHPRPFEIGPIVRPENQQTNQINQQEHALFVYAGNEQNGPFIKPGNHQSNQIDPYDHSILSTQNVYDYSTTRRSVTTNKYYDNVNIAFGQKLPDFYNYFPSKIDKGNSSINKEANAFPTTTKRPTRAPSSSYGTSTTIQPSQFHYDHTIGSVEIVPIETNVVHRRPHITSMPVNPPPITYRPPVNVYKPAHNVGSQTEQPFNVSLEKVQPNLVKPLNTSYSFNNADVIPTRNVPNMQFSTEPNFVTTKTAPVVIDSIFDFPTSASNIITSYEADMEIMKPPPPPEPVTSMEPPKIEIHSPSGGIHRVPNLNFKPPAYDLESQGSSPSPYIPQQVEDMIPPKTALHEEVMGLSPPPPVTTHRPILHFNHNLTTQKPIFSLEIDPPRSPDNRPVHPYTFDIPASTVSTTRKRRPHTRRPFTRRTTIASTKPPTTSRLQPYSWSQPVTPIDGTVFRRNVTRTTVKPSRHETVVTEQKEAINNPNSNKPSMEVIIGNPELNTASKYNITDDISTPVKSNVIKDILGSEILSVSGIHNIHTQQNTNAPTPTLNTIPVILTTSSSIYNYNKTEVEPISNFTTGVHHAGNEVKIVDDSTSINILPSSTILTSEQSTSTTPFYKESKVITPTRYITHTKTSTVTITKTTVVKTLGGPPSTMTILVTKTEKSTVVDTVTEIHTLVKPTNIIETITTTINQIPTTLYPPDMPYGNTFSSYPSIIPTSTVEPEVATLTPTIPTVTEAEDDLEEFIIHDTDPPPESKPNTSIHVPTDNDSIFVVMTDQKHGEVITIPEEKQEEAYETQNRDDVPTNNEVNHVLLGGILIASPPSLENPNAAAPGRQDKCQPECKASKNELCQKVEGLMRCVCRPGFARMFPDRPCKPTYTYSIKLGLERHGKETLRFEDPLADSNSPEFTQLAAVTHEALDRMVMQSDLRDIYHGVHVHSYEPVLDDKGIINTFYLQLSDNTDEKRLTEIIKKYLRNNNYSLGGTELYASKDFLDNLAAEDFDECANSQFHDCSDYSHCFNLPGTYTCSCKEGYSDLSENTLYPGRICSAELIGCDKCHYHGTCYSRGDDQVICECFQWYAGENCHINLKVLLIALVTLGTLLFVLLLICVITTCARRKPRNAGLANGMSFMPQRLASHNARRSAMDRRAMIQDTSSEGSQSDTNTLPYVAKKPKKLPKGALKKTTTINMDVENGTSTMTFSDQKDRSLPVMIPRAKYHPAPPTSPHLNMESFDKRKASASSNETKLLSYLDAGPSPNKDAKRKYSKASNDPFRHDTPLTRKISGGALVSAGFEVSATVGGPMGTMGTIGTTYGTEADRSENATLIQKISADLLSSTGTMSQFTTFRKSLVDDDIDDPLSNWLDIPPKVTATVSEARSYDETTIHPPTKSYRNAYDSKPSSQHQNDEANTMAERDVGSTFLLPHTHLYKPDRGSDISGFDSL